MPPLNKDLYLINEFWRGEYVRTHTHYIGSVLYSNSREARIQDSILTIISLHLNLRFSTCSACDYVYDKNENAERIPGQPICNQDICQTCPTCIRRPFIRCECNQIQVPMSQTMNSTETSKTVLRSLDG